MELWPFCFWVDVIRIRQLKHATKIDLGNNKQPSSRIGETSWCESQHWNVPPQECNGLNGPAAPNADRSHEHARKAFNQCKNKDTGRITITAFAIVVESLRWDAIFITGSSVFHVMHPFVPQIAAPPRRAWA
mmetsp:Transcript_54811/g.86753  ORF Transcript_54811/g.86753 Transcript_54811/m.86753 type:complete len:132 (+) Transcript_54811:589-984(+)